MKRNQFGHFPSKETRRRRQENLRRELEERREDHSNAKTNEIISTAREESLKNFDYRKEFFA